MDITIKSNYSKPFSAFSLVNNIIQQAKKKPTEKLEIKLEGLNAYQSLAVTTLLLQVILDPVYDETLRFPGTFENSIDEAKGEMVIAMGQAGELHVTRNDEEKMTNFSIPSTNTTVPLLYLRAEKKLKELHDFLINGKHKSVGVKGSKDAYKLLPFPTLELMHKEQPLLESLIHAQGYTQQNDLSSVSAGIEIEGKTCYPILLREEAYSSLCFAEKKALPVMPFP